MPGTGDGRTVMVSWVARAVGRASAMVQLLAFAALAVSAQGFRWQA